MMFHEQKNVPHKPNQSNPPSRQKPMNLRASVMLELLIFLITVVLTSVMVLFLVQSGVIAVQADGPDERTEVPLLDTEFIPIGREGTLTIKEFQFCDLVNAQYQCRQEKTNFLLGEEVHFRFVVESTPANGEIMLVENYRLLDPAGKVILDVDEKNNFYFNQLSSRKAEQVTFKDYFIAGFELAEGEYTLELWLENPLLGKKVKVVKRVGIWSYTR